MYALYVCASQNVLSSLVFGSFLTNNDFNNNLLPTPSLPLAQLSVYYLCIGANRQLDIQYEHYYANSNMLIMQLK